MPLPLPAGQQASEPYSVIKERGRVRHPSGLNSIPSWPSVVARMKAFAEGAVVSVLQLVMAIPDIVSSTE